MPGRPHSSTGTRALDRDAERRQRDRLSVHADSLPSGTLRRVTDFDAELYLRQRGEQTLRSEDTAVFDECARVLAALGLLELTVAHDIVGVYRAARALRGSPWFDEGPDDDGSHGTPDYHVHDGGRDIETSFGKVRVQYLALAPTATRIAATVQLTPQGRGPNGGPSRYMPFHPHMPQADVRDDRGRRIALHFNGGGSASQWAGAFVADEGFAPGARWVEFCGERIDLVPVDSGATILVGSVGETPRERALAYLRFRTAQNDDHDWHHSSRTAAFDTIRATGLLTPEELEVGRVAAPRPGFHPHRHPHRGVAITSAHQSGGGAARRATQGRQGRVLVGATTPVFDGIVLSVLAVRGESSEFLVDVQGATARSDMLLDEGDITARLVFAASDDRGTAYSGGLSDWSEEGYGEFGGTLRFEPGIDPSATRLTLELTTRTVRTTVSIPLRWTAP